MPESTYSFFSERERRYLNAPEEFDQQERAEIRYRLRTKYADTVDALSTLHESPELWDKRERNGTQKVECRECRTEAELPYYKYKETDQNQLDSGSWHDVEFVQGGGYMGWCDSCWHELRERGRTIAVEKGVVPCSSFDCNTHKIRPEHRQQVKHLDHIPFSNEELAGLRTKWRDRRHHVCPECGQDISNLTEDSIKVGGGDLVEVHETEGWVCSCGWEGFKHEMSFVKKRCD